MNNKKIILLSFDVEEFDMPLEYGQKLPLDSQLKSGYEGLLKVKNLLSEANITATLFTTANFARHFPSVVKELSIKHEIASHTYYHSVFRSEHLRESKLRLEKIIGKEVTGLRMPRMKIMPAYEIAEAGYTYDASINPVWLPGRYNNMNRPREIFLEGSLVRIPASVTSILRIPLFWLSFKNISYPIYRKLVLTALRRDGYVSLYFHPWEFIDLSKFKMPAYSKRPCGEILFKRLIKLLSDLKNEGEFETMGKFSAAFLARKIYK